MTIRVSDALRTAVMVTGTWKARLDGGFLFYFDGTQPSTAELAATGTLLAAFSIDKLGVTGLTWEAGDNSGEMKKTAAEAWEALGLDAGVARYARFQRLDTNLATTQAAAIAATGGTTERVDLSIGTSGADIIAASVSVALNAPLSISAAVLRQPASLS